MQPGEWTVGLSLAAIVVSCITLLIEFNIWLKARKTQKLQQKWDREDFEDQRAARAAEQEQDPDEAHDRD